MLIIQFTKDEEEQITRARSCKYLTFHTKYAVSVYSNIKYKDGNFLKFVLNKLVYSNGMRQIKVEGS